MKYISIFFITLFSASIIQLLSACSDDRILPSAGIIIRVPDDVSTISAAISEASSGDTVLVSVGIHSETNLISIDKDLTLTSAFFNSEDPDDISNTIIRGGGINDLFIVTSGASFKLEGFTVENTRKPITVDVGQGIIRNNIFRDNSSDSISFEGDSSGIVEFNTIINSGDDGIDIDGLRGPYIVRENIILGSSDDGMEFRMINIYLTPETINYEVYDNIIDGAGGDGIQLIDYPADNQNLRKINIHHNYIKNVVYAGIGTMPDSLTNRTELPETYPNIEFMERVYITNNTIVSNDNGISGGDNFIVLNNIIANNQVGVTNLDGNSRLDYTMFLNNYFPAIPPTVQGNNIFFDDPMLNFDGSLQHGSPSVDAGVSRYSWKNENVLNITIFNGSSPDLGWLETE